MTSKDKAEQLNSFRPKRSTQGQKPNRYISDDETEKQQKKRPRRTNHKETEQASNVQAEVSNEQTERIHPNPRDTEDNQESYTNNDAAPSYQSEIKIIALNAHSSLRNNRELIVKTLSSLPDILIMSETGLDQLSAMQIDRITISPAERYTAAPDPLQREKTETHRTARTTRTARTRVSGQ